MKYSGKRVVAMLEGRHGDRGQLQGWLKDGNGGEKDRPPVLSEFSLPELCEAVCGDTPWYRQAKARLMEGSGGYQGGLLLTRDIMEAGTPTNLSDFKDIVGQLIFNEIRTGFDAPEFEFSRLVPVMQSRIASTETVPEISPIGDVAETVLEGEEYPTFGFGSNTYTLPAGVKKGLIVDLTEESMFFDLTGGGPSKEAARVGQWLGLQREKRLIDAFIGVLNNYIRNGTATDTYLTAGAYVNASVIALNDETDIDEVDQAFNDILDPDTGEPITLIDGETLLVCVPALRRLADRITRATEVRQTTAGVETLAPATIRPSLTVLSTKLLYRRVLLTQTDATKAKTWWFLSVLSRLLRWKENWALEGFTQGPDSNAAFERDVSLRWKARYRGEAVVREPRYSYRAGDNT